MILDGVRWVHGSVLPELCAPLVSAYPHSAHFLRPVKMRTLAVHTNRSTRRPENASCKKKLVVGTFKKRVWGEFFRPEALAGGVQSAPKSLQFLALLCVHARLLLVFFNLNFEPTR